MHPDAPGRPLSNDLEAVCDICSPPIHSFLCMFIFVCTLVYTSVPGRSEHDLQELALFSHHVGPRGFRFSDLAVGTLTQGAIHSALSTPASPLLPSPLCGTGWPEAHEVEQVGFTLTEICLILSPGCWDYSFLKN